MTFLHFIWVKYLVITELTIATLFAQVLVVMHQIEPPSSLVASYQPPQ